jgi:hypothetical protein
VPGLRHQDLQDRRVLVLVPAGRSEEALG